MTANPSDRRLLPFPREGGGLEFDRVANFSDAVFAIALTLIAVGLKPPALAVEDDPSELAHALGEMSGELIIFFVAFAVMGSYWLAHHRFLASLRGVDSSFVFWTLPYLAWVAFLPFPAALMGPYFGNPVAVSVFAVTMAVVSLIETVLLWRAHVGDLFTVPPTPSGFRWSVAGSLSPVVVFLVSIPLMWVSTTVGVVFWAANAPIGLFLSRFAPTEDEAGTAASPPT